MTEHEKCKVCGFPHDGTDHHSDCIFAQAKEIERLRSELDKRKWIPVSERLPEHAEECIVFAENDVCYGYYDYRVKAWRFTDDGFVFKVSPTHWMPLPEKPEIKQSNNDRAEIIP